MPFREGKSITFKKLLIVFIEVFIDGLRSYEGKFERQHLLSEATSTRQVNKAGTKEEVFRKAGLFS